MMCAGGRQGHKEEEDWVHWPTPLGRSIPPQTLNQTAFDPSGQGVRHCTAERHTSYIVWERGKGSLSRIPTLHNYQCTPILFLNFAKYKNTKGVELETKMDYLDGLNGMPRMRSYFFLKTFVQAPRHYIIWLQNGGANSKLVCDFFAFVKNV